ncbi:MAG: hypothetical protein ICV52_12730 [Microcoleus sp. C1-bin4]|nr:hypothetical protein [Microcoleus sp. C1-bin4]
MRATNQFPNSHRVPRVSPWKTARCPLYQIRLDRSGYRSAIEDDGDRRRSQSTLWAKILAARSTF